MKRYEMPMVELTKFDVEDIMVSGGGSVEPTVIDTAANKGTDIQAAVQTATGAEAVGVYNW